MGVGKPRLALSRWRVRTAKRTIVALSVDEVARFGSSFRNSRDLATVGRMLLQGLRSQEVLALRCDEVRLSEAQIRVRDKGNKTRFLPLAPEATAPRPLSAARTSAHFGERCVCFSQGPRSRRRYDSGRITLAVSIPSPDYRRKHGQPAPISTHLCPQTWCMQASACRRSCSGRDTRVSRPPGLRAGHSPGGLSAICSSRGAAHPAGTGNPVVRPSRYAPLEQPLAPPFQRAIKSLTTALALDSSIPLRGKLLPHLSRGRPSRRWLVTSTAP